jgi:23S rRNA (cytidine1920-2'-O)/16S rRNA (cytidine1409-2'-O)-methyltransferase
MKERLDVLLVKKGFLPTREKAKRAIMAGLVIVDDKRVDKAGTLIKEEANIRLKGDTLKYVSRGGLKLEKAIKVFEINMQDRIVLDVGASTGGFTDCALQNGATYVYSVDVGTNQLDWKLRQDERVKSLENMHIKNLKKEDLDDNKVDIIVIDVSFISLTKVLLYLSEFLKEEGKIVALIKPQFEVGRENIDKGGIVKDYEKHKMAIEQVIKNANENNLYIERLDVSPITGTKGNKEYISCFSKGNKNRDVDLEILIKSAKNM